MKRFILALCAVFLFATLEPAPVSAWWWHHHAKNSNAAGANAKTKRTHEKYRHDKVEALYNSPKTVGWWHKSPGPMGAGSGSSSGSKTQSAHHEKHHKHSIFAWRHHHDADPGATGATGK